MAKHVAASVEFSVISKHLPPKLGTMPVISTLKWGRDVTISIAFISMPSSTISRTVFVCAKVARPLRKARVRQCKINPVQRRKYIPKTTKQTLQTNRISAAKRSKKVRKQGDRSVGKGTVHVFGRHRKRDR